MLANISVSSISLCTSYTVQSFSSEFSVLYLCDPSGPAFSVYGQNKPSMTPFGQPLAGPGMTNNPFMVSTVQPLPLSLRTVAPYRGAFSLLFTAVHKNNPGFNPSVVPSWRLKRRQPRGRLGGWVGGGVILVTSHMTDV